MDRQYLDRQIGAEFVQKQPQDSPWNSFDNMNDEEQGLDIWGFLQRRKSFVILLKYFAIVTYDVFNFSARFNLAFLAKQ